MHRLTPMPASHRTPRRPRLLALPLACLTAGWLACSDDPPPRSEVAKNDPAAAEAFFTDRGFTLRRIPTFWRFPDRATRDAVLRIEFSRDVAERAIAATTGLEIAVGYRLHVRRP